MRDEVRIRIAEDTDLIPARAEGRALAERQGFTRTDATLIATAISEIARNIVVHAREGAIVMTAR
jgi:serine/threonine-protein kinase RsbT